MMQLTSKQSGFWDRMFSEGRDYSVIEEAFLNEIILTQKISGKVLDIGCGTGDLVVRLARRGFSVTGIDYSAVAIAKAEERIKRDGVSARLIVREITTGEDVFDAIFCKLVYAFIVDKLMFLKEVEKRLNNNGSFILITPILDETNKEIEKKPGICATEDDIVLLQKVFSNVTEYKVEYTEDGRVTKTFVCRK